MSQPQSHCQKHQGEAQCDICPLRKGGELSGEGEWKPVGSERHQSATVIAIAESPGPEEVDRGRPLVGRSGGEWNDTLRAVGKTRPEVDLTTVVLCKLPGQSSGAWGRMEKKLDKLNKKRATEGLDPIPHPATCCSGKA